jgi:hypothetical protein
MRRHMKVHTEQAGEDDSSAAAGRDDDVVSEAARSPPGQPQVMRPRQGSRSSI